MFGFFVEMEKQLKAKAASYFTDPSKIAMTHAFGVPHKHRGRGLATLMNTASIKMARDLHCDYLYAHMVTPETIHISEKTGYHVLNVDYMDENMFVRVHQLEKGPDGEYIYPEGLRLRVEELGRRFGDQKPRSVTVVLDLKSTN